MATELGKAYVQIVPSAKGIGPAMEKSIGREADSAGKSIGGKLAGTLKTAIAAAGIGTAIKKSLDLGAELEQNLGGTKAVFGNFADTIQEKAKSAYMNMGLSASDYMATANKMGSLFQGSGVEQSKALQMTSDAMQRAADVASVMGVDMSMAMESIAGAAKGNFTMMDNLGVAMNATTLEAYALEKGMNFKWNTASNAEKAELAMKMFMERTSTYAGNFAAESKETLSGAFGAMKAASQDFMANLALGQDVKTSMNALVTTAVTAASTLIPKIGNIFKGLPGAISTAISAIHPELMKGLKTATNAVKKNGPKMIQNALKGLLNFSKTIRKNAGQLVDGGLSLIKALANSIIKNIPTFIKTVPTIISNFAGVINDNAPKVIKTGLSIIKSLVKGLISAIPVLVQNIPKIIKAIWDVFTAFQWINLGKTLIKAVKDGILAMKSAFTSAGKNLTDGLANIFTNAWAGIKNMASAAWTAIKTLLMGVWNGIKASATTLWTGIKTAITLPITAAKTELTTAWNAIKTAASTAWSALKSAAATAWNAVKTAVTTPINAAKTALQSAWNTIRSTASGAWEKLKSAATSAWEAVKSAVTKPITSAKTALSDAWSSIKSTASGAWDKVKSAASTAWGKVKSAVTDPISSAKSTLSGAWDKIKSTASGAWSGIRSAASSAWDKIKSAITKPIETARDTLKSVMDKIKGFFPLKVGKIFSNIKLPKIEASKGKPPWGILGKGEAPKFSIKWNKFGGVYDSASIIGIGVGEAGREIVTPETLMRQIVNESNASTVDTLTRILGVLEYIAENDKSIQIDKREFGRLVNEVAYG